MPLFFSSNKLPQLTDDGTTLTIKSTGSSYVRIGDGGTTTHSLNTNDDLLVTGKLEVDGIAYFDSTAIFGGVVTIKDSNRFSFGTGSDSAIEYNVVQTANTLTFETSTDSNSILMIEQLDRVFDFAHPQQTNPTYFIHSANQSTTEWISFTHDQTDGILDCGTGAIRSAKAIATPTLTFSTTGPTDDLDVSGINVLFIDNSSNAVTIGGFVGGVDGQILHIALINAGANNVTLEHNEGTGNQDILLHAGADEVLNTEYGGWVLVCHGGVDWHDVSHSKHV